MGFKFFNGESPAGHKKREAGIAGRAVLELLLLPFSSSLRWRRYSSAEPPGAAGLDLRPSLHPFAQIDKGSAPLFGWDREGIVQAPSTGPLIASPSPHLGSPDPPGAAGKRGARAKSGGEKDVLAPTPIRPGRLLGLRE